MQLSRTGEFYPPSKLRRVPLRLIGVLDTVELKGIDPHMTLRPYYANDATRGKELLTDPTYFDPEFDMDCQEYPLRLQVRRKATSEGGLYFARPETPIDLQVYDNTSMQFDNSRTIPAHVLQSNDLVVTECYLNLQANPDRGAAAFYLVVQEIHLIHASLDEYSVMESFSTQQEAV
ncbi:hypothetical protein OH77DRAFT_1594437 [Trametes cingulata]|nr:hypothetical protein OH77DRAFT_1594437 [Trametes cingulata]